MSKRVRTSRVVTSKKSRRPRPSGEREVTGRESASSVDFDDRASTAPSEAPPGVESSAPPPAVESSAPPPAVESSAPPAASTSERPSGEVPSRASAAEVASPKTEEVEAKAEEVSPTAAELTPPPPAVVEVGTSTGKKKKKKGGAVGGTRPEDINASSGAHSLNEPLARGFYESAPPHDLDHDHDHDDEPAHAVALSPEVLERKARLRRIVMGVFAAASLVVLLVAGKTLLSKNAPPQADVSHALDSAPAPRADEPAKPTKAEPPKVAEAPTAAPAPAPESSAKADEKKDDAKADEKKDEPKAEEKKDEAPKGDPAELKKTATKLYNSGKLKDAVPALRDAIAADPEDAILYLFLGDALTNTGKWPDAKEAYNECVRKAKKGPKSECVAMGGHK